MEDSTLPPSSSQITSRSASSGSLDTTMTKAEKILLDESLLETTLDSVHELVDPRLTPDMRPDKETLDESYGRQLQRIVSGASRQRSTVDVRLSEEPIYVEFREGDRRNPINYSAKKKWIITMIACASTWMASTTASTYSMGFTSMSHDLNSTHFQGLIGLSVYALGFGLVPLVSASLSEEFGRRPLYLLSGAGFLLMYIMIALSKNIQTVLIARFFQGSFGSTGSTMVGGTIADIWGPKERGLPMSIFTFCAIGGTGAGPVFAGWIEENTKLEWRWIEWIQLIICFFYLLIVLLFMNETRSSILLAKLAKKLRKETGDKRYRSRAEDERDSLANLIYISCTRPVHLLFTEPIVLSFSLWVGFAWGIVYGLLASITLTFSELHNFSIGQVGTVFVTMAVGSLMGLITNFSQERLYHKGVITRGPEARLYWACAAAVLLPSGMFIYAWTSFTTVSWIGGAIGIVVFIWATFIIYLAVFTYLADCYGPFASSALAGQSLARNMAAMSFPLFTDQMYRKLTFPWASTLLALIGCLMIPIPFVLFFKGKNIRAISAFSKKVEQQQAKN